MGAHPESERRGGDQQILAVLEAMGQAQQIASTQITAQLIEMRSELKALTKADSDGAVAAAKVEGRLATAEKEAAAAKALSDANASQITFWKGALFVGGLLLVVIQAVVISWVNSKLK